MGEKRCGGFGQVGRGGGWGCDEQICRGLQEWCKARSPWQHAAADTFRAAACNRHADRPHTPIPSRCVRARWLAHAAHTFPRKQGGVHALSLTTCSAAERVSSQAALSPQPERLSFNDLSAAARPSCTRISSSADWGCLKHMAFRHRSGPLLSPTATGWCQCASHASRARKNKLC